MATPYSLWEIIYVKNYKLRSLSGTSVASISAGSTIFTIVSKTALDSFCAFDNCKSTPNKTAVNEKAISLLVDNLNSPN